MTKYPGTVDIIRLRKLFYGLPETEVIHKQENLRGAPGRICTRVTIRAHVADGLRLSEIRFSDTPLRGYIDDRPFDFVVKDIAVPTLSSGDPIELLNPFVTIELEGLYVEKVELHPVVAYRRRKINGR